MFPLHAGPLALALLVVAGPAYSQAHPDPLEDPALPPQGAEPWTAERLLAEVREANPTLRAAQRALQGAEARVRVLGAWPEPELMLELAPLSLGSDHGPGYGAQLSQRLPFSGQPGLDRRAATFERAAASEEAQDLMLRLAEEALSLYAEYWLLHRSVELLEAHHALVEELGGSARARFETRRAPEVAPLRAELELARVAQQRLALIARRDAVGAAINGLRHRPADAPLPTPQPPPDPVSAPTTSPEAAPRLRAAQAQTDAARLRAQRARRAWTPEPLVMVSYNTMWPEVPHRFMIGAGIDLPLAVRARRSAVDAAEAEILQREALAEAVADQLAVEAQQARVQLQAAEQTWSLVRGQVLPLAEQRLQAARAAFASDQVDFGEVIEAERERLAAQLSLDQARAAHRQAQVRLAVASGRLPGANP